MTMSNMSRAERGAVGLAAIAMMLALVGGTVAVKNYLDKDIDNYVVRLIAGDNIDITPDNGLGIVTIAATGGGGGDGTATTTLPADNVTIVDNGSYYASDNVEGALQEIAASGGGGALSLISFADVTGERDPYSTPYHNGANLRICYFILDGSAEFFCKIGATSPPTSQVVEDSTSSGRKNITLIVPPNYYYCLNVAGGSCEWWFEMDINVG